jgi:hypothetical protein
MWIVMLLSFLFALGSIDAVRADPIEWPISEGGSGHAYDTVSGTLTWEDARQAAESMEFGGVAGHLATITSEAEHVFVRDVVGPCPACWLGGYQLPGSAEPEGGWTWITGEAWSFIRWYPSEPNNDGDEKYIMTVWWDDSHLWNDEEWPPFEVSGFILEFDLKGVKAGRSSWGQVKALYR